MAEPSRVRYLESELRHPAALGFGSPDAGAIEALREHLASLPVRPYEPDTTGIDPWEELDTLGPSGAIVQRLTHLLREDLAINQRELGHFANFRIVFTSSNLRPDALHALVVLEPKSRDKGAIIYGARVQRVEPNQFALWSDF